jgi:peptide/nickel transport system substrate-binding protein
VTAESKTRWSVIAACTTILSLFLGNATAEHPAEDLQREQAPSGRFGGRLIASSRGEPKTFNPLIAFDAPSREVIGLMTGDLIHINRLSLKTEPALAKSWTASRDGRSYELHLRRGIRFSDGHPMDADDVLFTFQACLDERTEAPQRDLLIIQGKPITLRKIDSHTVQF